MTDLEGVIERITFQDEENGYTVARFQADGEMLTVVGFLPNVNTGETLRLSGDWIVHPTYGRQFKAEAFEVLPPVTRQGIERYLGSGLIKGIGPVTAKKMVQAFGLETLKVINETPERLLEVEGIGPQKAEKISKALEEQRQIQRMMVFLRGVGITPALATKIYRRYGEQAAAIIKENPYRLADELFGVGFRTADRIANLLGRNDPAARERVRAGVLYYLRKETEEGHVYVPVDEFVPEVSKELAAPEEVVKQAIEGLVRERELYLEEGRLYLAFFYRCEQRVAERLCLLMRKRPVERPLLFTAEELNALTYEQRLAVEKAFQVGVLMITGGPGTGKTTTIRSLIRLCQLRGEKALLAAPTGRAAKRLKEATGKEAKTIHRLLEFGYTPGRGLSFGRNEEHPLEADIVIIDEVSMLDLPLFYQLLRALTPGTRLVLVGDQDQLPSVGPGSVLRDLITSEVIPLIRLQTIFRQAQTSKIVTNAHRINEGRLPELKGAADFFFINAAEPQQIVDEIIRLVTVRLPRYLKCDPVEEIQVLSPMRRTLTGVENLNYLLQEALNPPNANGPEIRFGEKTFRPRDKVMQIRNNYAKMVFNGDLGKILRIDPEEQVVTVAFADEEERILNYAYEELDELVLAYAISVHKSQGSEYPVVVMPVTTQHYLLLQRNLFYTGITRAKKMVVLVGTKRALAIAVKNNKIENRYSWLASLLVRYAEEAAGSEKLSE
ncbi:MAG TPA: ATP-dependent RecD-like DNA helicase [Firmicutes bacterium]|jgi:exodeoxyribonuclease V alpha subunit|nr:ATP-dependent RecD-like DNA helicase [Bacillota bacterium]